MAQFIESDALLLNPRGEDIPHLLYAIPMAAPYSTLNDALVKSKLVPAGGATVKKGKLVKTVVNIALQDLDDESKYPEGGTEEDSEGHDQGNTRTGHHTLHSLGCQIGWLSDGHCKGKTPRLLSKKGNRKK